MDKILFWLETALSIQPQVRLHPLQNARILCEVSKHKTAKDVLYTIMHNTYDGHDDETAKTVLRNFQNGL